MNEYITLDVLRYNPEENSKQIYQSYEVPFRKDWVILDALNYIKDELDGTLSFRWSCRMGVCGSCGMMVNGEPVLSCAKFLNTFYPGPIRIEPLENFPVVRDLVIEMSDFMEKLERVQPWIIRKDEDTPKDEYLQTPSQLMDYKKYSMCINCMLCYSACPVYGLEPRFLGPAAIAIGQRYNLDSRDEGEKLRNPVLTEENGIWQCTLVGECSAVCPKEVDPAAAIQSLKVSSTVDFFKSFIMPWQNR